MKGNRWIWGGLAVVVIAAGICVFYFMANTKSAQWIGVADSEPPNPEAQNAPIRVADVGEPAPPGTNEEDVLDAIGETLWTTLRPIYDPLLTTIDSPKLDMFGQLLLGNQNQLRKSSCLTRAAVHYRKK